MNAGPDVVRLPHLRDVSEWQSKIDWNHYATVAHPSLKGIYIRAGHGADTIDLRARQNFEGARRSRMHVGGYWYLTPGIGSPRQQVDELLRVAPHLGGRSLRPALDCEFGSPAGKRQWYLDAIVHARRRLGYWPCVYGSPSYLGELDLPAFVAHCPLWLADYDVATPAIPKPWTHWTAWQSTDKATDAAIATRVDDSLLADVRALLCPTLLQRARGTV